MPTFTKTWLFSNSNGVVSGSERASAAAKGAWPNCVVCHALALERRLTQAGRLGAGRRDAGATPLRSLLAAQLHHDVVFALRHRLDREARALLRHDHVLEAFRRFQRLQRHDVREGL